MLPEALKQVPAAVALEEWESAAVVDGAVSLGQVTMVVAPEKIRTVCRYLKEQKQFQRISSVTSVDLYPAEPRFEVVYHLHSISDNRRVRLKCLLSGEAPEIDSVTDIWRAADWYEREVFDLFGIVFRGHPNLKRIMMPEDWDGHPLRKDYPVHGHKYDYKEEAT
jgi:NADH-quinone oxidoreductase subunit C